MTCDRPGVWVVAAALALGGCTETRTRKPGSKADEHVWEVLAVAEPSPLPGRNHRPRYELPGQECVLIADGPFETAGAVRRQFDVLDSGTVEAVDFSEDFVLFAGFRCPYERDMAVEVVDVLVEGEVITVIARFEDRQCGGPASPALWAFGYLLSHTRGPETLAIEGWADSSCR